MLENQPFEIIWDGQLLDFGQLVIVAGTPNLDAAVEFLAFATSSRSMAAVSGHISYSPTRYSGLPLVGTHVEAGVDMLPHMPTYPENLERALRNDWEWWVNHTDEMNERFSSWLAR